MTRLLALFLSLCLIVCLCACNAGTPIDSGNDSIVNPTLPAGSSPQNPTTPTTPLIIEATVALSGQHSAYLDPQGNLFLWGNNSQYQVGYGGTKDKVKPYCVMTNIREVLALPFLTVALSNDGTLYTCGSNRYGEAGVGDHANASTPTQILTDVVDFVHDGLTGLAITTNGDLYAWGCRFPAKPAKILEHAKELHYGANHTAVLLESGAFYMFNSIDVGDTIYNGDDINLIESFRFVDHVATISMNRFQTAAITKDGELYIAGDFGYLSYEQYPGDGPHKILDDVESISLGDGYVLAITSNRQVYCHGEMTPDLNYAPGEVIFENAAAAYAGDGFAMFLDQNCNLFSFGKNEDGRLGTGHLEDVTTPTKILENVASVTLCGSENAVAALTTDGTLYTWGYNYYHMLGYEVEPTNGSYINPTPKKVLDHVLLVSFGAYPYTGNQAAAICEDGSVYFWGSNTSGEVGNGNDEPQITPYLLTFSK